MGEVMEARKERAEMSKSRKMKLIGQIKRYSNEGLSNAEIAAKCSVSESTVRHYKETYRI